MDGRGSDNFISLSSSDVFLSYRAHLDRDIASKLYDALHRKNLDTWLDTGLIPIESKDHIWRKKICGCSVFVPIISREALNGSTDERKSFSYYLKRPRYRTYNIAKLVEQSAVDDLLVEFRVALELKRLGLISAIFPILVGDKDADPALVDSRLQYFLHDRPGGRTASRPRFERSVVVESIESSVSDHFHSMGLDPPPGSLAVNDLFEQILSFGGGVISGSVQLSLEQLSDDIKAICTASHPTIPSKSIAHQKIHKAMDLSCRLKLDTKVTGGRLRAEMAAADSVGMRCKLAIFQQNREGDFLGAQNSFEIALQREPSNTRALYNYARFLEDCRGDIVRARKTYEQLIELEPKNDSYLRAYERFLREKLNDNEYADKIRRQEIKLYKIY